LIISPRWIDGGQNSQNQGFAHDFWQVKQKLVLHIQKITIYKDLNGLALILTHPYTGPKGRIDDKKDSDS
jgi:hypothetical protein